MKKAFLTIVMLLIITVSINSSYASDFISSSGSRISIQPTAINTLNQVAGDYSANLFEIIKLLPAIVLVSVAFYLISQFMGVIGRRK